MRASRVALIAFVFLAVTLAALASNESKIESQLHELRGVPEDKRPAETAKIAERRLAA